MKKVSISCSDIAAAIDAKLHGDGSQLISSISSIESARSGSITFIASKKFLDELRATTATAVILPPVFSDETNTTCLIMENPYLGYARLTALWTSLAGRENGTGVHSASVVHESVVLGANVTIGANAVVAAGAKLGDGVVVDSGAYVGEESVVGSHSIIHTNATVMHDCKLGSNCEIHPGAVIGADGFGFVPDGKGWAKIHQLGGVRIGDRVSVGACTTVDRGALEDTVIGDGVILDNHIQVAHNVNIGANTAIAGCTGIAGSATIGANCRIGGSVNINGHITICDDVVVTATSFVNKPVLSPGSYSSGFPLQTSREWRKNTVRLRHLDELSRQVGKLKS